MLTYAKSRVSSAEGDDAAIYAFGTNVGRQLNELCVFSPRELDLIFEGAKDMITQAEPRCDPQVYLPNGFGESTPASE